MNELRDAAGHPIAGSLSETQTYNGGLIALDIRDTLNIRRVVLFINPHSLYITGWMTPGNVVYHFSDANDIAIAEMRRFTEAIGGRLERAISGSWFYWHRIIQATGAVIQEWYDATDYLQAADDLARIRPFDENPRFARTVATAMSALAPAYSEALRYTLWRNSVGAAMELSRDGSEARVLTPTNGELRENTQSLSRYLWTWRAILREPNPDLRLPAPYNFGPRNGTVETRRQIERVARLYISETSQ
ncbi:ribosome-inactivating family protein [Streptomyces werraensis]|uniref:ribosome-inactivating family protein n=1 Tax=Streptomyces werraensis TaxID=68284 RepID=UPI00381FC993